MARIEVTVDTYLRKGDLAACRQCFNIEQIGDWKKAIVDKLQEILVENQNIFYIAFEMEEKKMKGGIISTFKGEKETKIGENMKYLIRFLGYGGVLSIFYSVMSDAHWEMPLLGIAVGIILIWIAVIEVVIDAV